MDALSVRHENVVACEICIEISQTPANARANKGSSILLEDRSVVGCFKSRVQVQLNVGSARRRGAAVLMASSPYCHGNSLVFGVSKHKCNVVLVSRLDYQPWVHVVVHFVAG